MIDEIEWETRFERRAWETFKRFTKVLTRNGFADTVETAAIAASLTQSTMINSLDAEVGNVVDVLSQGNHR